MSTAPERVARLWLNHLTLGPILVEGRRGRWYAPSAARQVWRWYRPVEPEALEPFSGWLPFEALAPDPAVEGRAEARSPGAAWFPAGSGDRLLNSEVFPGVSRRPNQACR